MDALRVTPEARSKLGIVARLPTHRAGSLLPQKSHTSHTLTTNIIDKLVNKHHGLGLPGSVIQINDLFAIR